MAIKKKTQIRKISKVTKDLPARSTHSVLPQNSRKVVKYGLLIAALFLVGVLAYLGKGLFVVALVDGKPISRFALDRELEKQGGKQTLDDLITKTLIGTEAKKVGITVTNEDVQVEIKKISNQVQAQGTTLDAALAMQGTTLATLEDNIRIQKTVEGLLKDKLVVSEDEIKTYFDENKASYGTDPKYDELKETIRQQLSQQKLSTEFKSWIDSIRAETGITYFVTF